MRFSKRQVFTFSIISLIQLNLSTLNAGQISALIESVEAGSEGNVKFAITRKLDMQKLRQAQVKSWIDGIQSLKHTHPDIKVEAKSLTEALKVLENLKDYLVQKVNLLEGETAEMDDWGQSQGQNISIREVKTKYLELRAQRTKYTQSSAKAIQEQTTQWALLVKPESFGPTLEKMTEPLAQALSLVEIYEDTLYGDDYDVLKDKSKQSKQSRGTTMTPEETAKFPKLHVLFNGGSPGHIQVLSATRYKFL